MKKLSIYALTAATALAVTGIPVTAYAASGTYATLGGNQKVVVIGGNSINGLKDLIGQTGGNISLPDCDTNLPGFPGNFPGINLPGSNKPDNSLPDAEIPSPDGPEDSTPSQPDTDGSMDAYAAQVVKLVNEERAKAGLSPLTVKGNVTSAADVRAKELEASFSHTRPNGSDFSSALTAAGVSYRGAGENIAYGQKTPEQVMQGWMNSAGHRANILNASFTSIGVGHYRSAAGVDYWTQLFIQ